MMKKQPVLAILGAGYTGRFLYPLAAPSYTVFASSRAPLRNLSAIPLAHQIEFDLAREDTWKTIPCEANLIWCFPATPLERVRAFAETLRSPGQIVVLGSTSAYEVGKSDEYPPPWIDETAPIDLCKPRVQGEEYLRKEQGAMVLRVAGIYGPGRNPSEWTRQGRVGPSRKYVNLIHVEDLAAICLAALERGKPGEVYNVSDGQSRTWKDLCELAQTRWNIRISAHQHDHRPGKRIRIDKLHHALGYRLRRRDLYEELDRLEAAATKTAAAPSR